MRAASPRPDLSDVSKSRLQSILGPEGKQNRVVCVDTNECVEQYEIRLRTTDALFFKTGQF
jgi:hypothetical protein